MRDRAQNDKVVEVIEPLDTISLIYNPDNEDRLAFVKAVYPNYNGVEVSQIIKVNYADYLNANNETDNVATTVEQRTWVKRKVLDSVEVSHDDNEADEKYTILEKELEALIKNQQGGSLP